MASAVRAGGGGVESRATAPRRAMPSADREPAAQVIDPGRAGRSVIILRARPPEAAPAWAAAARAGGHPEQLARAVRLDHLAADAPREGGARDQRCAPSASTPLSR